MTAIRSPDFVADRADVLAAAGLNGMRLVLVALPPGPNPPHATLEVHFYNALHLAAIVAEITATPARAAQIFRVHGGTRIPAGPSTGQVKVTGVAGLAGERLTLTVAPVGDYSTYTLELVWDASRIDPFFSTIDFKFRPGCFTNDCAPAWQPGRPPADAPAIDYLAKDYDSFRHALITVMAQRVPGWQSTSEADFDQVLIDLFAAAGDELSDYQDRVFNEAYLATARSRVSLARHARLVDYHIHQGNQASTWLVVEIAAATAPFTIADELVTWTGSDETMPGAVFFSTRQRVLAEANRTELDPTCNRLRLHTWRNAQPALRAGATTADLVPDVPGGGQAVANHVRDRVRNGRLAHLVIAERLNPLTGREPGRDPGKRQLLTLIGGMDTGQRAETIHDPVTNTWLVRVHWLPESRLRFDYSFTTFCDGVPVEDVSMFHGNVVRVHAGRPMTVRFHERDVTLPSDAPALKHRHIVRLDRFGDQRDWVLCPLPEGPLAYLPTSPGGEVPPRSTARVTVTTAATGSETWDEVPTLIHSDDSPEEGDHFMVETDERATSVLRFGNGTNGRLLPAGVLVECDYQVGNGAAGNVGADTLVAFRPLGGVLGGAVTAVWNPFDVADGRDPEPVETVRRAAPEAYRARQLRAVTLADYVRRAEEVPGVSRAVARYAWTGSWRTVRVVIDPAGTTTLGAPLRARIAGHLEAVRLIGEDLELRPPRFVPLDIRIVLCAHGEYWAEDLQFVLEQEFSAGYTPDGRRGFFHPDEWTFGQSLHRSMLEGRVHAVTGVDRIVAIRMKRFSAPMAGPPGTDVLDVAFDEVVQVASDPSHLERGFVRFDVQGGRL